MKVIQIPLQLLPEGGLNKSKQTVDNLANKSH